MTGYNDSEIVEEVERGLLLQGLTLLLETQISTVYFSPKALHC